MGISAKIVCDSISPQGVRLTTLELCYPRFIHSEVMTHRMFSRNASSSRAIPIQKMIDQVKNSPAMPIHWGKNQPGMQAREEHSNIKACESAWKFMANCATEAARALDEEGLHKQIVNRVLEPYQWIKVIVTATEWDNFFKLRDHSDAQPEIRELARCMKKAMEESTITILEPGEWHMPYLTSEDWYGFNIGSLTQEDLIKCSVARCARVSYNNHDSSSPNIEKDIALADKLLEAGHMSPFEHQATPMPTDKFEKFTTKWIKGVSHYDRNGNYWSGNFKGWIQYRNLL